MVTVRFETDNAAFHDDDVYESMEQECARVLRVIADELAEGLTSGDVRDINGNKIGDWVRNRS